MDKFSFFINIIKIVVFKSIVKKFFGLVECEHFQNM
jgi:hypothetical protein